MRVTAVDELISGYIDLPRNINIEEFFDSTTRRATIHQRRVILCFFLVTESSLET